MSILNIILSWNWKVGKRYSMKMINKEYLYLLQKNQTLSKKIVTRQKRLLFNHSWSGYISSFNISHQKPLAQGFLDTHQDWFAIIISMYIGGLHIFKEKRPLGLQTQILGHKKHFSPLISLEAKYTLKVNLGIC